MPARDGGAWCVYDVFQTADGPVFIAVTSDAHWERFCAAFPIDDLRDDPALATHDDRVKNRPKIIKRLTELFATMPSAEILRRCHQEALIPAAPVSRPDQLFDDPHLNTAGGLIEVALSEKVRAKLPALPLELDGKRLGLRMQPPAAGADTRAVLTDAGLSEAEIARLADAGVIDLGTTQQTTA